MERALDLVINLKGEAESQLQGLADMVGGLGPIAAGAGVAIGGALVAGLGKGLSLASEAKQGVNDLAASLGITKAEAEELGGVATEIFGNNWGDSLSDVNQAVGVVRQQLGDLSADELQSVTEGVLAIRDVFGQEVTDTANTAAQLMRDFGLSGKEATDFITKGLQTIPADDLLDSIREYGPQFAANKATAGEFFSALQTGAQSGVLGTDKVADLFKEMRLRISDDSAVTRDALNALGIPADVFFKGLRDGSLTGIEAFNQIQAGIARTKDPLVQQAAGVALMGTQFEDLGPAAVLAIDTAKTSLEDLSGATDSLNVKYDNFGSLFGGAWRTIQTEILLPVGDKLLDIANNAMPLVQSGIEVFGAGMATAAQLAQEFLGGFQSADFSDFYGTLHDLVGPEFADLLTTGAETVRQFVTDIQAGVQTLLGWLQSDGTVALSSYGTFFQQTWQGVLGIVQAVLPSIRSIIETVMSAVSTFLDAHGTEIRTALSTAWQTIQQIVSTAVQLVRAIVVPAFQQIAAFIAAHKTEIVAVLSGAWQIISNLVQGALTLISGVLRAALQLWQGDWRGAWETIKATLSSVWENLKGIIQGAVTAIQGLLSMGMARLAEIVRSVGPALAGAGRAIVDMLKQGISSAWEGLKSFFSGKLAELRAMLPFSEPKDPSSPLRGLVKTGATIVKMIQSGIDAEKLDLKPERVQVVDSFLGIIKGATDTIATVLDKDLFAKLRDFKEIEGPMLQPLINTLVRIVHQMEEATEDFEANAIGKAAILAEAIGKIVGVVGSAVGNLNQLDQVKDVPGPIMQRFINTLMRFVYQFDDATEDLETDGMHRAAGLAEAIQKIVGVTSGGVQNLNKILEVEDIPGPVMQRFIGVLMRLVYQMEEAAQGIAAEGLLAATTLGEGIGKIVAPLKDAVQLFLDLQKLEHIPGERLQALAAGVHLAVYWMIEISKGIEQEGLKAAAKAAQDITAIFGAFRAGTDVIKGLDDIKDIPPNRFAAFKDQITIALGEIVHLTELGGGMLYKANEWRDQMKAVKNALDEGAGIRGTIDEANQAMGYGAGSLPESQYQQIGQIAMAGGYNTPATPGWQMPELGGSSMESRSAGKPGGTGTVQLVVQVDARGSTLSERQIEEAGYRGAQKALREMGFSAAARQKLGAT